MEAIVMPAASTLSGPKYSNRDSLRDRLRDATADAHARLDAQLDRFDLARLADYRDFLEVSAAALLPLEAALVDAGVERIFADWPLRARSRAILDDLDRVGGGPHPLALPGGLGFADVLGTMYVLEGSRLGAKVLLRRVASSSDPVVSGTTRYLRHGAGLHLWPSFLVMLERHRTALHDDGAVIAAACRAFALFAAAAARLDAARHLRSASAPA
jgi:heme oxygenase